MRNARSHPICHELRTADMTDGRPTAEELNNDNRLLRHVLDSHEREQKLVAYEIHDCVVQQATGALFHFEAARESAQQTPEQAAKELEAGLRLLEVSIQEARRLIGGLRPSALDDAGIEAAVDYLVAEMKERYQLEIEFLSNLGRDRLAPPLQTTVSRNTRIGPSQIPDDNSPAHDSRNNCAHSMLGPRRRFQGTNLGVAPSYLWFFPLTAMAKPI